MQSANLYKYIALFCACGLLGCVGGGGGSGGSLCVSSCGGSVGGGSTSAFNTAEFQANFGLASINALTAYDSSATGEGITVAVIDTGIDIDNPEFTGAISSANFVVGVSPATGQDQFGHGTSVAGVIGARKNGSGTHGVAFESNLLSIRADDIAGQRFSAASIAVSVNFAVAQGARVVNLSLGGPFLPNATYQAALQSAVDAGVIIVAAAGNEGGEVATEALFPARLANCNATTEICTNGFNAQGNMIAVGSVDLNNNVSSFSNPAGDTASAFLVAPGENIVLTRLGGGTRTGSGTSFATPHVSGALALVLQRFPTLSAAQAVDLLLTTATDLGASGTDTVFGRGLLNIQAAFLAQGVAGLATSDQVIGPRIDFFETSMDLGPSFGNALSQQNFLGSAIILDAYDRPFRVDLRDRIINSTSDLTVAPFLENNETQLVSTPMPKGFSLNFEITKNDPTDPDGEITGFSRGVAGYDLLQNDIGTIRFSAELGTVSEVSAAHEASTLNLFSNGITEEASGGIFFNSSWISSPQLTLLGKGDSLKYSHSFSEGTKLDFGIHRSSGFASASIAGAGHLAQAQFSHKTSNGFSYGLTTGYVLEENSLFSSSSNGAFGTINDNRSLHTSLSASWEINDKTNIFATYTDATVKPSFTGAGLVDNWSRIYANSFAVGVTSESQFSDGDRLGISFGQPLRVRKSSADLTIPVGRDLLGNVLQETQRVNLVPTGRQIDIQLAYSLNTGNQSEVSSFAVLSFQPGHDHSADPEPAIGLKWRRKF